MVSGRLFLRSGGRDQVKLDGTYCSTGDILRHMENLKNLPSSEGMRHGTPLARNGRLLAKFSHLDPQKRYIVYIEDENDKIIGPSEGSVLDTLLGRPGWSKY